MNRSTNTNEAAKTTSDKNDARDCAIITSVAIVPAGSVVSYGYIARAAGFPGRARLVGKLLRDLPTDTKIPWHRVLKADRQIAFTKGSRQYRLQKERLCDEGVLISNGRVADNQFLG